MVAFNATMSMYCPHLLGHNVIVGEQGAAVPKATERFCWEKTGAANQRDPTATATISGGTETLSGILNDV